MQRLKRLRAASRGGREIGVGESAKTASMRRTVHISAADKGFEARGSQVETEQVPLSRRRNSN